jgi:copper(I)-binding protein
MRGPRAGLGLALIVVAGPSLVACSVGAVTGTDGVAGGPEAVAEVPVDGVILRDAWIRPTPPVTNVGAFYLTVVNGADRADRVVGARSPRCAEVEIHRSSTVEGVATMDPATSADLEVAAGGTLVFEPSGLHVMCLGLTEPVVEGEHIPLTVELVGAGELTVEAVAEGR